MDVPGCLFREVKGGDGHCSLEKEKGDRSKICISRSEQLSSRVLWSGNITFIVTKRQLRSKTAHYSWLQSFFSKITVFVTCALLWYAKLRHLFIMHQYCWLQPGPASLQKQKILVALRLEGPWCTVVFFSSVILHQSSIHFYSPLCRWFESILCCTSVLHQATLWVGWISISPILLRVQHGLSVTLQLSLPWKLSTQPKGA